MLSSSVTSLQPTSTIVPRAAPVPPWPAYLLAPSAEKGEYVVKFPIFLCWKLVQYSTYCNLKDSEIVFTFQLISDFQHGKNYRFIFEVITFLNLESSPAYRVRTLPLSSMYLRTIPTYLREEKGENAKLQALLSLARFLAIRNPPMG